jgi:hypothetical protein
MKNDIIDREKGTYYCERSERGEGPNKQSQIFRSRGRVRQYISPTSVISRSMLPTMYK